MKKSILRVLTYPLDSHHHAESPAGLPAVLRPGGKKASYSSTRRLRYSYGNLNMALYLANNIRIQCIKQ